MRDGSILFIAFFFFCGCEKFDLEKDVGSKPKVVSSGISAVTGNSAVCSGNVVAEGGAYVTSRGICWSLSPQPTIADQKTTEGSGKGAFTSLLTNLTSNTKYYIRAYATNRFGTAYGEELTFTTTAGPGIPTLTTLAISAVTDSSAMSGGNITSDGGAPITERGVCWNTLPNPNISHSRSTNGTGSGIFISTLTGLSHGTIYYVRAYAINSAGVAYGNQMTFKTLYRFGYIPTDSLKFYYPFSGNAGDSSGYGNHGTLYGGYSWTTDRFGRPNKAIQLNGTNAYVLVPNSAHYPTSAITIAYWFNRNGINPVNIECYLYKDQVFQSYLLHSDKTLWSGLYRGISGEWKNFSSSPFIVPNNSQEWLFYAFSYSNTDKIARVYINGNLVSQIQETDATVQVRTSTKSLNIGRNGYSASQYVNGKIDDIRIYTRVLDSVEVRALYHEGGW